MPIEIYGKSLENNITGSVLRKDVVKALHTPQGKNIVVDLDVDGKIIKAIPYQIQIHPVKNNIRHIDFLAVVETEDVVVSVPVLKTGTAVGEVVGGRVIQVIKEILVKSKPMNISSKFICRCY